MGRSIGLTVAACNHRKLRFLIHDLLVGGYISIVNDQVKPFIEEFKKELENHNEKLQLSSQPK